MYTSLPLSVPKLTPLIALNHLPVSLGFIWHPKDEKGKLSWLRQNCELSFHFLPHQHCTQYSSPFTFVPPQDKNHAGQPYLTPSTHTPLLMLNKVTIRTAEINAAISAGPSSHIAGEKQSPRRKAQHKKAIHSFRVDVTRALATHVILVNGQGEERSQSSLPVPHWRSHFSIHSATSPLPGKPFKALDFQFHRFFSHLF